jgi:hypothetical protein
MANKEHRKKKGGTTMKYHGNPAAEGERAARLDDSVRIHVEKAGAAADALDAARADLAEALEKAKNFYTTIHSLELRLGGFTDSNRMANHGYLVKASRNLKASILEAQEGLNPKHYAFAADGSRRRVSIPQD